MNNDNIHNESNSGWDEIPVPISADAAWQSMNALLDQQQAQKRKKFFWLFSSVVTLVIGIIGYYFLSIPKSNTMMIAQTEETSVSEHSFEQKSHDASENAVTSAEVTSNEELEADLETDKKDKINEEEERVETNRAKKISKNSTVANTRKYASTQKEVANTAVNSSAHLSRNKKAKADKNVKSNSSLLASNNTIQKNNGSNGIIGNDANNNIVAAKDETYLMEEPRIFSYLQPVSIKEFTADSIDASTLTNIEDKRSAKDYNPYVMGVNMGVGLNKTLWNNTLRPAFISLFVDYYFMPKYAVGIELTPFHTRGSKYSYTYVNSSTISDNADAKVTNVKNDTYNVNTLNYSDVCVHLKHSINNHFILGFGLYGSYLQTANMNVSLSDSTYTYNKQTKNTDYNATLTEASGNLKQLDFTPAKTLLKKYDIGTVLSAYYILNNWQVGINYQRGLINYSANHHAAKFYTQYLRATIGFRF